MDESLVTLPGKQVDMLTIDEDIFEAVLLARARSFVGEWGDSAEVALRYYRYSPYIVTIDFKADEDIEPPMCERLDREMMIRVVNDMPTKASRVGEGDICFYVEDSLFVMVLMDAGEVSFELNDVSAFLAETRKIVALGAESEFYQIENGLQHMLRPRRPQRKHS